MKRLIDSLSGFELRRIIYFFILFYFHKHTQVFREKYIFEAKLLSAAWAHTWSMGRFWYIKVCGKMQKGGKFFSFTPKKFLSLDDNCALFLCAPLIYNYCVFFFCFLWFTARTRVFLSINCVSLKQKQKTKQKKMEKKSTPERNLLRHTAKLYERERAKEFFSLFHKLYIHTTFGSTWILKKTRTVVASHSRGGKNSFAPRALRLSLSLSCWVQKFILSV